MKNRNRYFIDSYEGGEAAILIQVDFHQSKFQSEFEEFRELALSAGVKVLSMMEARRLQPTAKYFLGEGKAQELAEQVKALEAEVVLVNHDLSAAQQRNLENLCHCRVVDRTALILDIFASRARSFEGRLQVELAQLEHLRTRLVRGWTHLERQKGGIGLRGPGETQLESDKRMIGLRIKAIKNELKLVLKQREQRRRARVRAEIPTLSLVGYTNAGKSSVFNRLTQANVYAADQLFATLDPTLRKLTLPKLGKIILADTVGFIRDLPHELVAAFRATLEETQLADLLLHVMDSHEEDIADIRAEVDLVLKSIEADQIPQLLIYNKIDLRAGAQPRIDRNSEGKPWRVWLSAKTGEGFDLLEQALVEILGEGMLQTEVRLGPESGKLRAELYALKVIKNEILLDEGGWLLKLEIPAADYKRFFPGF